MRRVLIWTTRTTCDFSCRYCYYTIENRENNRIKDLDKVLNIISPLDIEVLYLSGEPTLYKNLINVIEAIRDKGIKVVLTTHGARFTLEYAKSIISTGVEAILISLDGPDRNTNNITRQDFDKVVLGIDNINAIRREISSTLKLGITFVVHARNLSKMEDTLKFAISKHIDYFHFQPVSLVDNKVNSDLILSKDQYRQMIETGKMLSLKYKTKINLSCDQYQQSLFSIQEKNCFEHSCFGGKFLFFLDEHLNLNCCPTPNNNLEVNFNGDYSLNKKCKDQSINCVSMVELIRSNFP